MRSARLAILAAALAVGAALPATAGAGSYTVFLCRASDGGPAPMLDWTVRAQHPEQTRSGDGCPGGPFAIELLPGFSHTADQEIEATFRAPPGTNIQSYALVRTGKTTQAYDYYFHELVGPGYGRRVVAHCGNCGVGLEDQPQHIFNVLAGGAADVTGLQFVLTCSGPEDSPTRCPAADPTARLRIYQGQLQLRDDAAPVLSSPPTGSLVDTRAPLSGVRYATIEATDRGGGVYEALVEVDGRVIGGSVLDSNGGRCRPPFTVAAPCKTSVKGTVAFDTSQLPDGPHSLRLLVSDATTANVAAWGPIQVTTANGPPDQSCNPAPRVRSLRMRATIGTRRRATTTRYGRRLRVSGRLTTPQGAPVAGAKVCVAARAETAGAALTPAATVVTDAKGRFSYRLARGTSRRVYFVHRRPEGAVTTAVRVRVRAPVSLRASRRRLRNRQTVVLTGRARAAPIPARGLLVEIQARRPDGWQTFGTTRTSRRGRFRFPYTFTRTTGVQRYRVRARIPQQPTYPYAAGASRRVVLTVWR